MRDENRYGVYDGFACYFDRYWGRSFFDDLRPVVEQCFLPLLPASGAVLDLCCGSGRLSHWLTVRGFEVSGVDGSEEMVRLARKNAPRASFRVADVRRFCEPESFDGVVCTFDSLNHLASGDDLLTVFQNVARSLRPGGLFFFDMNLDEGFRASAPETSSIVAEDHACITESVYDSRSRRGCSTITLFRLEDGNWRRSDVEVWEYCYPREQIVAALAEAGLPHFQTFEAGTDFAMRAGAGRLFVLASKQPLPAAHSGR